MLFHAGSTNLSLKLVPQHAVAHKQESHQWRRTNQSFRCFDQVLVTFEVKQPCNLADHHMFGPVAQLATNGLTQSMRLQKRFDLDAAIDSRKLLPRGHAGTDEQIGHGIGHAHETVAALGPPAFATAKERSGPRALVRMERSAMNRMDNCPNTQTPCGSAAQDSTFGAMRMNDVGAEFPQGFENRAIGKQVANG